MICARASSAQTANAGALLAAELFENGANAADEKNASREARKIEHFAVFRDASESVAFCRLAA